MSKKYVQLTKLLPENMPQYELGTVFETSEENAELLEERNYGILVKKPKTYEIISNDFLHELFPDVKHKKQWEQLCDDLQLNEYKVLTPSEQGRTIQECINFLATKNDLYMQTYATEIYNKTKFPKKKLIDGAKRKIKEEKEKLEREQFAFNESVEKTEVSKIDERFENEDLLKEVYKVIDSMHQRDDLSKMALFLIAVSAELSKPELRMSAAVKGNSSSGKDNMMQSIIKLFPAKDNLSVTRATSASLEEEGSSIKRIVFSEINRAREGANYDLVETVKQFTEGGVSVIKKDKETGVTLRVKSDQKTVFYATTESEIDEEMHTRFIVLPCESSEVKNRIVVNNTLKQYSGNETAQPLPASWFTGSLKFLKPYKVIIPFAQLFENEFDLTKDRIKRDVKRFLALVCACAWIHQKQRIVINETIYAEPADWYICQVICDKFFAQTYNNLEPRLQEILDKIEELKGQHTGEIASHEFPYEFHSWVIRSEVCKALDRNKETFKDQIKQLKDNGYIESHYDKNVSGKISLLNTSGGQVGVKSVFSRGAEESHPLITHWIPTSNLPSIYKEKKFSKPNLDFLDEKGVCVSSSKSGKTPTYSPPSGSGEGTPTDTPLITSQQVRKYIPEKITKKAAIYANIQNEHDQVTLQEIDDHLNKLLRDGDILETPKGVMRIK